MTVFFKHIGVDMGYLQRAVFSSFLLALVLFNNLLVASTASGYDWLEAQINSDNNYSASILATSFQSLSELSKTKYSVEQTVSSVVMAQIQEDDYNSTEHLSRKIESYLYQGKNSSTLVSRLLSHQLSDGGYGELAGYNSTVLDTAYALRALELVNVTGSAQGRAVSYLLSHQNSDGSWSDGLNTSDVTLTAIAMHALWSVRKSYDITASLSSARSYLETYRQGDGLWQSDDQSALVLIAIAPTLSTNTTLLNSITALQQAQQTDQSWSHDIYSTSLVLQALLIASKPVPNPDLGSIRGVVVDDNTGIALADVNVSLNGIVKLTDLNGIFEFSSLAKDNYILNITKESYAPIQAQIPFDTDDIDFGEIRLQQTSALSTAVIRGVVRDSDTKVPIINAKVVVNGIEVYTDTSGAYQVSDVMPGVAVIQAEASDYLLIERTIDVNAGYIVQYEIDLKSVDSINADIRAIVKGVVVDASTQQVLSGVEVTVTSGTESDISLTDTQGGFQAIDLSAGSYQITFSKSGFINTYGTFTIERTQTIDFGVVALKVDDPNSAALTNVNGTVVDKITKEAVDGALVTINGISVYTDTDGHYSIDDVGIGSVTLTVLKTDYEDIFAQATINAGSTLIFSPELTPYGTTVNTLFGTILDANNSQPISDVNITITGSTSGTAFTDIDGNYYIEGLASEDITVTISKSGYKSVQIALMVIDGSMEFSPALHSILEPLNGKSTISGAVIDLRSTEKLADVAIYMNDVDTGVRSDVNGTFKLEHITEDNLKVTLKRAQYKDIEMVFVFNEPQNIALGTMKMRQITIDDFKADLTSEAINTSGLIQDPYTLSVAGEINVTVANRGTLEAQDYDVVAFYDLNSDSNYTEGIDRMISHQRITDKMAVDTLKEISMELNTTADFRDQPIYIVVDAKNENIELNEVNNYSTTARSCGGKQGSMDLAVCFDYSGSVGSLANMQKAGLIEALRDPNKFPRDGSIRLTIMTAAARTYLEPTVIGQDNAETVADSLENMYFSGSSQVDRCLYYAAAKLASLPEESSYKAITLSGDGYWGGQYAYYRDIAVSLGVDVIDVIGVGRLNWNALNTIVYPQPVGGDAGVVTVATTAEEVSNSLVRTFKKQTEIADMTIGKLSVVDHGVDSNLSVGFRVGNAGIATIGENITVSIYEGDPNTDGILLKSMPLEHNITSGSYIEMYIHDIVLQEGGSLYVVGDRENALVECSKLNNVISTTLQATTTLGTITAYTDKNVYGAFEDVNLSALVHNPGRLSYALTVEMKITDTNGTVVQSFAAENLGVFNSGEDKQSFESWNTALLLSGNYELHTLLYDNANNLVDEAVKGFSIDVSADSTPNATLAVRTDRAHYHTSDRVIMYEVLENKSVNALLEFTSLELSITNVNSDQVYAENITVGTLTPAALVERTNFFDFTHMSEGNYTVVATLHDLIGNVLATASTTYQVREEIGLALQAQMHAQFSSLDRGETQFCTLSLNNSGIKDINVLATRGIVVYADTQSEVMTQADTISLVSGDTMQISYSVATDAMELGEYFCLFQAQLEGSWQTMAYDTYTLTEPPIQINTQIGVGSKAPLLILLDSPQERGWCFDIFSSGYEGHDPYGPYDAPMLSEQRAYLENLLNKEGYSYKIVESATAFKEELRSGNYGTYALFNEYIKLSSQTLSEVREAVYRGAGLLFAGKHQYCNDELQTPLGLDFKVTHDHVTNMTINMTNEYTGGNFALQYQDKATRFRLKGAEQLGSFEISSGFFNFCPDDEKYALTRYRYKNGKSVFAAFDLLMQASDPNGPEGLETLLLEVLKDIEPESFVATAGSVYPMHLSLVNEAIATQGQTITTFSSGTLVDTTEGNISSDGKLYWNYLLAEGGAAGVDYWLKIPAGTGAIDVETDIYAGAPGLERYYATVATTINIDTQNSYTLQDALSATEAVSGGFLNFTYNSVEYHLNKALYYENRGEYAHALSNAIEAADCLVKISKPEADDIHNKLAHAIGVLSTKL